MCGVYMCLCRHLAIHRVCVPGHWIINERNEILVYPTGLKERDRKQVYIFLVLVSLIGAHSDCRGHQNACAKIDQRLHHILLHSAFVLPFDGPPNPSL